MDPVVDPAIHFSNRAKWRSPLVRLIWVHVVDGEMRSHIGDPGQLGELTAVIVSAGQMSRMQPREPLHAQARRFCLEPT